MNLAARLLAASLCLFSVGSVGVASAQSEMATVENLLRKRLKEELRRPFERMSAERWSKVGPMEKVRDELIVVARERDAHPTVRSRALEALAFFPGKRTTQVLWQAVYERSADGAQKRAALRALGHVQGVDALSELTLMLRDGDADTRAGAILGLGAIRDPRVRHLLENQLDNEADLDVRLLVDRVVTAVRARDAAEEAAGRNRGSAVETPESHPLHGVMER